MKRVIAGILALSIILPSNILSEEPQVNLTIACHEGAGLFAEMNKIVQALIHLEDRLVNVEIDWTDEFFPYKDGPFENGWYCFFEPIPAPAHYDPTKKMVKSHLETYIAHETHDQVCTTPWVQATYQDYLPYRKFVNHIMTKYIKLKPHVLEQLDAFYNKHMNGHLCIGVHARVARQHRALIPGKTIPTIQDYCDAVDAIIIENPHRSIKIFVASDSHQAIGELQARYGSKIVNINAMRSKTDQDPCIFYTSGAYFREHKDAWHRMKHKTSGGLSSLLDCLLLSKCDHMIHTTSNLAFFAAYYNPDIATTYLPRNAPHQPCAARHDRNIRNPFLNPIG